MSILSNRVHIERDQTNQKLENDLFSKLSSIVQPAKPIEKPSSVKFVGVEDAIKELLELEKTSQGN